MADKQFRMLIHRVARDNNLKGIAAVMGIPYSTLAEQLNPNSIKKFDVADLPDFLDAADDHEVLAYLAQRRGGVYFLPPSGPGEAPSRLADCLKEFGEMVQAHADMDADGRRKPHEKERVRREGYEVVQAVMSYLAAMDGEE